ADVQLEVGYLDARSAVGAQRRGLLDLSENEQAGVELARFIFRAGRDAELHVVESFEIWFHRARKNEKSCRRRPVNRKASASVDCAPTAPASATLLVARRQLFYRIGQTPD